MKTILLSLMLLTPILHAVESPILDISDHFSAMHKLATTTTSSPNDTLNQINDYFTKNEPKLKKDVEEIIKNHLSINDPKLKADNQLQTFTTISKATDPLYRSFGTIHTKLVAADNKPALKQFDELQQKFQSTLAPLDKAFAQTAYVPDTTEYKIIGKHFAEINKITKENEASPEHSMQLVETYFVKAQPELIAQTKSIAKQLKSIESEKEARKNAIATKASIDAITYDFKVQMSELAKKLETIPESEKARNQMSAFRNAYRSTFLPVTIAIKELAPPAPTPAPGPIPGPPPSDR